MALHLVFSLTGLALWEVVFALYASLLWGTLNKLYALITKKEYFVFQQINLCIWIQLCFLGESFLICTTIIFFFVSSIKWVLCRALSITLSWKFYRFFRMWNLWLPIKNISHYSRINFFWWRVWIWRWNNTDRTLSL